MFVCPVQIISGLDKQSDFKMFTVFSGRHIGTPIWAPIRMLIRPTGRVISHQPLDFKAMTDVSQRLI